MNREIIRAAAQRVDIGCAEIAIVLRLPAETGSFSAEPVP